MMVANSSEMPKGVEHTVKMKTKLKLPKSTSPRIEAMCDDSDDSLEALRFRRDLAMRDGDMSLALACAIAIDRKKQ